MSNTGKLFDCDKDEIIKKKNVEFDNYNLYNLLIFFLSSIEIKQIVDFSILIC